MEKKIPVFCPTITGFKNKIKSIGSSTENKLSIDIKKIWVENLTPEQGDTLRPPSFFKDKIQRKSTTYKRGLPWLTATENQPSIIRLNRNMS